MIQRGLNLFAIWIFISLQVNSQSNTTACPPLFNCNTTPCLNFGTCQSTSVTNTCACNTGWGGDTCQTPICGSLVKSNFSRAVSPGNHGCLASQCDENWSGQNCNVCNNDNVCSPLGVLGTQQICNKGPVVWADNHHGYCTVDNDLLSNLVQNQVVNATFQKNAVTGVIFAAIFINNDLQFSCTSKNCRQTFDANFISSAWECDTTECICNPGSYICGGGALVDLTSAVNDAKGSYKLSYNQSNSNLNAEFLSTLFANGINLIDCTYGECVRADASPIPPVPLQEPINPVGIGAITVLCSILVGSIGLWTWALFERKKLKKIPSPPEIHGCSLKFDDICYKINNKGILFGISGEIQAGQFLAIMGPSGCGKTTFLDILAKKNKSGKVTGNVLVNGAEVDNLPQYRNMIGYVDQEDIHIPSLTVRETLEFSAFVRLPESIDSSLKRARVETVIKQLGLSYVADSRVGDASKRGLSGGEKKRLSIAVALVTNPAVVFIDEPTSGLDSFSALQTIKTLARLAKESQKTIVCTIHQPNSAIFSLFDQVLLLSKGKAVYLGPAEKSDTFCIEAGFPCPPQHHIADHLLDVAVAVGAGEMGSATNDTNDESQDANQKLRKRKGFSTRDTNENLLEASLETPPNPIEITPGASTITQIEQVMSRSFKVFKRHPLLFYSHLGLSIFAGIFVGLIYFKVDNTLAGLQNRLGSFFFLQSLLAFGGLSAISSLSSDRLLFIRERSNGFYGYFPYFLSKICFDLIPLRIIPAIFMSCLAYYMVGYLPNASSFFRFLLIMIFFNMNAGLHGLIIASMIPDTSTSTLVAVMSILFQMLFSGVLVNQVNIPGWIGWIQYLSFFKYAYEACVANEAAGLFLKAYISGINIQIPASTILDAFGLDAKAYYRDLAVTLGLTILLSTLIAVLINFRLREIK